MTMARAALNRSSESVDLVLVPGADENVSMLAVSPRVICPLRSDDEKHEEMLRDGRCYKKSVPARPAKLTLDLIRANGRLLQQLAAAKAQRDDADKVAGETRTFLKHLETQTARLDNAMDSPPVQVQPLFAARHRSHRAGNLGPLDHLVVAHGGTTSSYDELPRVLQRAKNKVHTSLENRETQLLITNQNLLAEMEYHNRVRPANF